MSATSTSLISCPTLQGDLNDYWKNCHSVREPLPFLEYLLSPMNKQPIVDMVSVGNGKLRTFQVRYDQRIAESSVQSNQPNPTCSASTKRADNSTTYDMDINKNLQQEELFDIQDLIRICRDNPTFIMQRIQANIDVLMRKLATQSAVEAVALSGTWGNGTEVTMNASQEYQVNTLRASTVDELAPYTMEEIDMAAKKAGFCDNMAIFSGSTLYQYARRTKAGCCTDFGIDLKAITDMYGYAVLWDRRIKDAFSSDDKALAVQNGALQMLTYNMFEGHEGTNAIDTPDYKRLVIRDPYTGFPIDMVWKDDCGSISMVFTATTKVIALPLDMYAAGDIYRGTNGVAKIKVVNT